MFPREWFPLFFSPPTDRTSLPPTYSAARFLDLLLSLFPSVRSLSFSFAPLLARIWEEEEEAAFGLAVEVNEWRNEVGSRTSSQLGEENFFFLLSYFLSATFLLLIRRDRGTHAYAFAIECRGPQLRDLASSNDQSGN